MRTEFGGAGFRCTASRERTILFKAILYYTVNCLQIPTSIFLQFVSPTLIEFYFQVKFEIPKAAIPKAEVLSNLNLNNNLGTPFFSILEYWQFEHLFYRKFNQL